MDRTRQIAERQRKINQGAQAQTAMRALEPAFERTQEILFKQFIQNSKEDGKIDEFTGTMLIALHDLKFVISEQIRVGHKAAEARQKDIERHKDAGDSA